MFKWKEKYGWEFAEGSVDAVGPNDADTGLFEGHPYKALAKEIIQNSLDARDEDVPDSQPVEVEFSCLQVPINEIPDFKRIDEVIGKCADFYNSGDDGQKLQRWKKQSARYCSEGTIPILMISDKYTTGLEGVGELKGTNWSGLVRERGATNKSEGKGGSHGVGKFAPFSFSSLRTVLYATRNKSGETGFQGKTILTSFQEKGKLFHNIGVFGLKVDMCPPVCDFSDIPEIFRRAERGTDVIVVGFERDNDWKEQIAISVLQSCFYAIYRNKLTVRIKDEIETIEISQESLSDQMNNYKKWYEDNESERIDDFQFDAPEFFKVFTHPKMKHFDEPFMKKGNIELFLVVDPEVDGRSIYEMRSTGMEIQQDKGWRGLGTHFCGLFMATGKNAIDNNPDNNIDSFLRKCENSAHNEWAASFYKEDPKEAKEIITGIHKWIREKIKEQMPKIEGTTHDAFGLNEYIQNINNIGDNTEEEDAFQNYEPQDLNAGVAKPKEKRRVETQTKSNARGKGKGKNKKKKKREGGNPNPNNKKGKKNRNVKAVNVGTIWAPFDAGKYHICFTPGEDYRKLQLQIVLSSDEQSDDAAFIYKATKLGESLKTYYGNILVGGVRKGEPVDIIVELDNQERNGLEVLAYAEQ